MQAALEANLGMMAEGEFGRSAADFDMNNLNSAAKVADPAAAHKFRDETCIRDFKDNKYSKLSVCGTSLRRLGEYGVGIELYFKLVKNIGILFFLIACVSIYPIYENSTGNGLTAGDIRQRWDIWHVSNNDEVTTQNDLDNNKSEVIKLLVCDGIYTGLFIIFIVYFQIYSNKTVSRNFEKNVSLADYSIEVKGIPSEGISEQQVAEHFSQFGSVVEVYLARSYNGILTAYKERALISYDIAYLRLLEIKGHNHSKEIEKLIKKMKKFDEKIEHNEVNSDKTNDELPVIRGFIVFESPAARTRCISAYLKDKGCCKRLKRQSPSLKLLETYPLRIRRAGAPSNIL